MPFQVKRDEDRIALVSRSLESFGRMYFPHYLTIEPPEYHLELSDFFDIAKVLNDIKAGKLDPVKHSIDPVTGRPMRLLDLEPREYGKTVRWSVIFSAWLFLCSPYGVKEQVLMVANVETLIEAKLRMIKRELSTNALIIADWGYQMEGLEVDRGDLLEARDGRHIMAKGIQAEIRGLHPTQFIGDDLEKREESKNPKVRKRMDEYLTADVGGAVSKTGAIALIGTLVHEQSLLAGCLKPTEATKNWIKRRYSAITREGKALWPEKETLEDLERQKIEWSRKPGGLALWYQEKCNIPMPQEEMAISPEWIDRIKSLPLSRGLMYRITWVDPAFSLSREADYTAIVTIGIVTSDTHEKYMNIYVLESERGRWIGRDKEVALLNHFRRHRPHIFGVEQTGAVVDWLVGLRREAMKIGIMLPLRISKPKPGEDKLARAQLVADFFQDGIIHFMPGTESLITEILTMPHGDFDDQADALIWALLELKRGLLRQLERRNKHNTPPDTYIGRGGY